MVLLALTVTVAVVGGAMVALNRASVLEAISFVTGAICVWLVVRENIWNFPIGLANTATFCVVFFQARLYGDAALQIVYFVLGLMGWYLWLFGGERGTRLRVVWAGRRELFVLGGLILGGTLVLWKTLSLIGGSASFLDAFTTSLSLGAQVLLNRKRVENWIVWIVADAVYVPLYVSKDLHLTALLYAVFLVMAVMGLSHWRAIVNAQEPARPELQPGP